MFPRHYVYRNIVRSKLYIDSNFSKNISLKDLSIEGCYSQYHFIRLFKELYGITPRQYLIQKRMESSKQLLMQGMNPSMVCEEVGYTSLQSFSNKFKTFFGITPSLYQENQLKNPAEKKPYSEDYIPRCFAYKMTN